MKLPVACHLYSWEPKRTTVFQVQLGPCVGWFLLMTKTNLKRGTLKRKTGSSTLAPGHILD